MLRKQLIIYLLCIVFINSSCFQRGTIKSTSIPIQYDDWTELLTKHVSPEGVVNYPAFKKDSAQLNSFLNKLKDHHPNDSNWSENEQIAYWINAYNAFTVKLVLDHYPVQSIKDIGSGPNIPFVNSPWDIKFFEIEKNPYDLNDIEHGILRKKFKEPRIHFAVNCASVSCPRLLNEAFVAERLDEQLNKAADYFINQSGQNKVGINKLQLSKIFQWYGGDFKMNGHTIIDFINQYTDVNISPDATIEYLDYNWNLNEGSK